MFPRANSGNDAHLAGSTFFCQCGCFISVWLEAGSLRWGLAPCITHQLLAPENKSPNSVLPLVLVHIDFFREGEAGIAEQNTPVA